MTHDQHVTTLLHDATEELSPDVGRLVAGGAARGRARRRRDRAGAALAAVAVLGVIGAAASVLPDGAADGRGAGVASEPSHPGKRQSSSPTPASSADERIAMTVEQIHARLAQLLPPGEVGPVLHAPPYPVVETDDTRILHFRYRGTLTSFLIEPAAGLASCQEMVDPANQPGGSAGTRTCSVVDGLSVLTWGPDLGDQVTAQGVMVWQSGHVVSLLSYNAPEGKEVPPVMDQPPLSTAVMTEIASSGEWFGPDS
jgi:hypothetical protein